MPGLLHEVLARIRDGREEQEERTHIAALRPRSTTPALKGKRLFLAANATDDAKTLPRPMSAGLMYAATVGTFKELADRSILDVPEDDRTHLSTDEVAAIYHAKCADLGCEPSLDRKTRFLELMSQQCQGQWFVFRQCGAGPRTAETVSQILAHDCNYTHVDLSGNNLGVEGAKSVAQLLRTNDSICVLRLQSCNLGEGVYHIVDALHKSKTLTALDFSGICGIHRNNVWGKSATALGLMMQTNQVLSSLNVASCGLQQAAGALIRSCLNHTALTHLDLSGNQIGDRATAALASFFTMGTCRLEALHLGHNGLTPDGIVRICRAMGSSSVPATTIHTLTLSSNMIGVRGCMALAALLARHVSLAHVAINDGRLCFVGADEDGYRIPENSTGVDALMQALVTNESIQSFEMRRGDILTLPDSTATALAKNKKLTNLDLSENPFGCAGAVIVAEGLRKNSVLQQLTMRSGRIGDRGGRALADAIAVHPALTAVRLFEGTALNMKHCGLLDAACQSQTMLHFECKKDDAAAIRHALQRNKHLRIQRAGPQLVEKHAALEGEIQALLHTQDLIVDEQRRREKTTDALKNARDRHKAAAVTFRAELQELTDQLERGAHVRKSFEKQLYLLSESAASKKDEMIGESARLNRKIEQAIQAKQDVRAKCAKLRADMAAKDGEAIRGLQQALEVAQQEAVDARKLMELMQKHVAEVEKRRAAEVAVAARPATAGARRGSAKPKKK